MPMIYLFIYCIFASFLCLLTYKAYSHKTTLAKLTATVLFFAMLICLFYSINFITNYYKIISFANSCVFICINCILIAMIKYIIYFSSFTGKRYQYFINFLYGIGCIDCIFLFVNPFYEITLTYSSYSDAYMTYWKYVPYLPYYFHLLFSYFIILCILCLITIKCHRVPRVYWSRYANIGIQILIIVFINALFLFNNNYIHIDLSILLYSLAAVALYWNTFEFSSKKMLIRTREMVWEHIGNASILFDDEDYMVDFNQKMYSIFPNLQRKGSTLKLTQFLLQLNIQDKNYLHNKNEFEWIIQLKDNKQTFQCNYICIRDKSQRIIGKLFTLNDITLSRDLLTGFYNKISLSYLATQTMQINNYPISVCICNLNNLSFINDLFSRKIGDILMQQLANCIRLVMPQDYKGVRLDDGDFLVLLPNINQKTASHLFQEIRIQLQKFKLDILGELKLDIEFGVSVIKSPEQDLIEAIHDAQDSMNTKKLMNGSSAKSSIVDSLAQTLSESDYETQEHVVRTQTLARLVGQKLQLSDKEISHLSLLAVLHDIGKVVIPRDILLKPSKLTEKEWEIMKQHTEKGYRIAKASSDLSCIADGILHHHERWDGHGYPGQLKGEDIPILSRIITVIDSYDVMTHDRPYHKAISKKAAYEELVRCSGTQFDPHIVTLFLEMLDEDSSL